MVKDTDTIVHLLLANSHMRSQKLSLAVWVLRRAARVRCAISVPGGDYSLKTKGYFFPVWIYEIRCSRADLQQGQWS